MATPAPLPTAAAPPPQVPFMTRLLNALNQGVGGSANDPSHTALMGLAAGLGQAGAPHMLTPISAGQALSMGLQGAKAMQAKSQAITAQRLANLITRQAALPFQKAKTAEAVGAITGQSNPKLSPQTRAADQGLALNLLSPGYGTAVYQNSPAVVGAKTLAQTMNELQKLPANERAMILSRALGIPAQGALPESSAQVPGGGVTQMPGAAAVMAANAANKAGGAAGATYPYQAALHPITYQLGKDQVQRLGPPPGQFAPVPVDAPGVPSAPQAAQAPAMQRMIGTQVGLTGAAQAGGRPAPMAPATGTPAGPGVMAQGLPPAQLALTQAQGTQAAASNAAYQKQAEDAKDIIAQVQGLTEAAHNFTPGQFADARIKGLQWMQSLGLITPAEMNRLGSAQEGAKMTIQLQSAFTRSLGSREAAQVFATLGRGVPNLTMSPDGFAKVSAYMEGMAKYNIARAEMAQHMFNQTNVRGVNNVRDLFLKNSNPAYYIIASAPPAIQREMVAAMGAKARPFVERWNQAIIKGYAPMPGQQGGP